MTSDPSKPPPTSLEELLSDAAARRHHERLGELLRERAFLPGEVALSSGGTSGFYVDCRRVVLTAEGHFLSGWLINRCLARLPEVSAVGGMTLGADPLASAASTLSYLGPRPLQAFYVRKEAKGHGTGRWIEGPTLDAGCAVAVVEDVLTTGRSCLRAIELCREAGLSPRVVIALVDRLEGGADAVREAAELPLLALYSRTDLSP